MRKGWEWTDHEFSTSTGRVRPAEEMDSTSEAIERIEVKKAAPWVNCES